MRDRSSGKTAPPRYPRFTRVSGGAKKKLEIINKAVCHMIRRFKHNTRRWLADSSPAPTQPASAPSRARESED